MDNNQGRRVNSAYWGDEQGTPIEIRGVLSYEYGFHGDHAEMWLIDECDGVEVARYNTRYLAQIVWDETDVK